jgi:hypothetical protein
LRARLRSWVLRGNKPRRWCCSPPDEGSRPGVASASAFGVRSPGTARKPRLTPSPRRRSMTRPSTSVNARRNMRRREPLLSSGPGRTRTSDLRIMSYVPGIRPYSSEGLFRAWKRPEFCWVLGSSGDVSGDGFVSSSDHLSLPPAAFTSAYTRLRRRGPAPRRVPLRMESGGFEAALAFRAKQSQQALPLARHPRTRWEGRTMRTSQRCTRLTAAVAVAVATDEFRRSARSLAVRR